MTSSDRDTIARKIGYLQKNLDMLAPYRLLDTAALASSVEQRFAVERLLQTAVESVIDCSRLIIAIEDWRNLRDERDAFLILAERAIIDADLAQRLLRAKGFRNILVHEYVAVDPALVARFLKNDLSDLQAFLLAIARWLQQEQSR